MHGAGEGLADIYRYEGRRFAQRGIAVLAYDKRGDGNSGGNAASGTLPNLAEDALAAVRYLQTRPEINSQAVGLWGVSQGGWIQPIAATQEGSGVAFLSSRSPHLAYPPNNKTYTCTKTIIATRVCPRKPCNAACKPTHFCNNF